MSAIGYNRDLHVMSKAYDLIDQTLTEKSISALTGEAWQKDLAGVVESGELDQCLCVLAAYKDASLNVQITREIQVPFHRITFGGRQ